MPDTSRPLEPDEHETPTKLGQRIPFVPLPWPADLAWGEVMLFGLSLVAFLAFVLLATTPELMLLAWVGGGGLLLLSAALIGLGRVLQPSPSWWLGHVLGYLVVLVASVPAWRARWLWGDGARPLAVVPAWLRPRVLPTVEIDGPGAVTVDGQPAVVLELAPRPNPENLPAQARAALLGLRTALFLPLECAWAVILQTRPFPPDALVVAAGPAGDWARERAGSLLRRRVFLTLSDRPAADLAVQMRGFLRRAKNSHQAAWPADETTLREHLAELWHPRGQAPRRARERIHVGVRQLLMGVRTWHSFAVTEMPRIVHLGWLKPLVGEGYECDVALHVARPRALGPAGRDLTQKIDQWFPGGSAGLARADAERVIAGIQRRWNRPVDLGLYVTCPASQAQDVREALAATSALAADVRFATAAARVSTLPVGVDRYRRTQPLDVATAACTDLLATGGYWPAGATWLGEALDAPEPIGLNPLDLEAHMNPSVLVGAIMGGGKTTTILTLCRRMALPHPQHWLYGQGLRIVSVDFKRSRDYQPLFDYFRAQGLTAYYNAWTDGPLPELGQAHWGFNLYDVPPADRGRRLTELAQRVAEAQDREDAPPLLLVVDELLAVVELDEGAALIREYGTQGRSSNVMPVWGTQDIEPLLEHPHARLAVRNAGHLLLGRQSLAGALSLQDLLHLEDDTTQKLQNLPDGGVLLRILRRDGTVLLEARVDPSPWELEAFGTNPHERRRRWERRQHANGTTAAPVEVPA